MTACQFARVCAALLAAAVLAGCGTGDEPPQLPAESRWANWPDSLQDFRFRWTAEPGIDLVSGPAVPLRAYLESHRVGDMTGDAEDAYPGFARAVPHPGKPRDDSRSDLPYELWDIQPGTAFLEWAPPSIPPRPLFGNEYFHVLELSPVQGGYRAYVCDGQYNIFHEDETTDTFEPIYPRSASTPDQDFNAVDVWRVEFTDQSNPPVPAAPAAVTSPQQGPNPAPMGDVFGPWQITGADAGGFWGREGTYDGWQQRKQQCLDKMPHDAAQRQAIYASTPSTPPAPEPALPGWPDNAA